MAGRRQAPFPGAGRGQPGRVNPLLLPPKLVKRAVDDLAALGDAARALPSLLSRLDAMLEGLDRLDRRVEALREEMKPIQNLGPVREEIEAMHGAVAPLSAQMDRLRDEVQPIQQLAEVRKGIEPLDEDMHDVRTSIDELEPLVERIGAQLGGMDAKLDDMRGDLAPLGELANKVPGVG